jgi:hypothetical protein
MTMEKDPIKPNENSISFVRDGSSVKQKFFPPFTSSA